MWVGMLVEMLVDEMAVQMAVEMAASSVGWKAVAMVETTVGPLVVWMADSRGWKMADWSAAYLVDLSADPWAGPWIAWLVGTSVEKRAVSTVLLSVGMTVGLRVDKLVELKEVTLVAMMAE